MTMLDVLQFVKGAVSKKDLVSPLTHFRIQGGRITGYNGKMSISAPIDLDIDCCPKAEQLIKAIEACTDRVQLHMTPQDRLCVRSHKFKALVDTVGVEQFPLVEPGGTFVESPWLLTACEKLLPFVGQDASRAWACGVVFDGQSAYATNNVIFAEFWIGHQFPYRVNIPGYAVRELVRIGEEVRCMQICRNSATFFFEGDRWLTCQLINEEWPSTEGLFKRIKAAAACQPIDEDFWATIEAMEPFTDDYDRMYLMDGNMQTGPIEDTAHAVFELSTPLYKGVYNRKMMALLKDVAGRMDYDAYPDPVTWYGQGMRGMIVGLRQ
jgi:DNA polymerase III sliding clamp (beta) subunit (PCNA family)